MRRVISFDCTPGKISYPFSEKTKLEMLLRNGKYEIYFYRLEIEKFICSDLIAK